MLNRIKNLPLPRFLRPTFFVGSRGRQGGGRLVLIAILLSLNSCHLPTTADDPSSITSLRFTPSAFDSFTKNTQIQYALKSPSTLSISIVTKDSLGSYALVRTIAQNIHETKGTHGHTWLGDTENGFFAPTGTYIGLVQMDSQNYETTVLVFHY